MLSLQHATALTLLVATCSLASPLALQKRNIGGVRLCDQTNWQGNCWYGISPVNTCIALNSFAGKTLSFRPDDETECFLMQNRCDASSSYADFYSDSAHTDDLTALGLPWLTAGGANSFICFVSSTPVEVKMRHLVRIAAGRMA